MGSHCGVYEFSPEPLMKLKVVFYIIDFPYTIMLALLFTAQNCESWLNQNVCICRISTLPSEFHGYPLELASRPSMPCLGRLASPRIVINSLPLSAYSLTSFSRLSVEPWSTGQ